MAIIEVTGQHLVSRGNLHILSTLLGFCDEEHDLLAVYLRSCPSHHDVFNELQNANLVHTLDPNSIKSEKTVGDASGMAEIANEVRQFFDPNTTVLGVEADLKKQAEPVDNVFDEADFVEFLDNEEWIEVAGELRRKMYDLETKLSYRREVKLIMNFLLEFTRRLASAVGEHDKISEMKDLPREFIDEQDYDLISPDLLGRTDIGALILQQGAKSLVEKTIPAMQKYEKKEQRKNERRNEKEAAAGDLETDEKKALFVFLNMKDCTKKLIVCVLIAKVGYEQVAKVKNANKNDLVQEAVGQFAGLVEFGEFLDVVLLEGVHVYFANHQPSQRANKAKRAAKKKASAQEEDAERSGESEEEEEALVCRGGGGGGGRGGRKRQAAAVESSDLNDKRAKAVHYDYIPPSSARGFTPPFMSVEELESEHGVKYFVEARKVRGKGEVTSETFIMSNGKQPQSLIGKRVYVMPKKGQHALGEIIRYDDDDDLFEIRWGEKRNDTKFYTLQELAPWFVHNA